MAVLNTASPNVSPTAPYDVPRNVRPSSSTSSAGSLIVVLPVCPHALHDNPAAEQDEHGHRDERDDGSAPGLSARRELSHSCHAGLPSSTVGRPRRKVATTRAGSVRPANGVFRPRLALCLGSTVQRASGSTSTRLAGAPGSSG